ncbi:MAG: hypothetical protein JWO31_238, partial [Phycisphaerales bacterium]|nr:hypothetical protein [Phycisphaerales bacterium]
PDAGPVAQHLFQASPAGESGPVLPVVRDGPLPERVAAQRGALGVRDLPAALAVVGKPLMPSGSDGGTHADREAEFAPPPG